MSRFEQRTDLAVEARDIAISAKKGELAGIIYEENESNGIKYQKLTVKDEEGENNIGKPVGTYFTVEIESVLRRESESFTDTVATIAEIIKQVSGEKRKGCTLVVGLGNREITPDGIGPICAESVLVTRHLKEHAPKDFEFLNPVSAIVPGVLGTSGIESADYIKWITDNLKPESMIVIDALAARNLDRLCRTVQITDTGITPGSGVGNSRSAINKEVMGIPVTAIGVPTVVDIRSLISEMGCEVNLDKLAEKNEMIVTPRNIDSEVVCASRIIAYAINMSLHEGLSIEDIDMMVG